MRGARLHRHLAAAGRRHRQFHHRESARPDRALRLVPKRGERVGRAARVVRRPRRERAPKPRPRRPRPWALGRRRSLCRRDTRADPGRRSAAVAASSTHMLRPSSTARAARRASPRAPSLAARSAAAAAGSGAGSGAGSFAVAGARGVPPPGGTRRPWRSITAGGGGFGFTAAPVVGWRAYAESCCGVTAPGRFRSPRMRGGGRAVPLMMRTPSNRALMPGTRSSSAAAISGSRLFWRRLYGDSRRCSRSPSRAERTGPPDAPLPGVPLSESEMSARRKSRLMCGMGARPGTIAGTAAARRPTIAQWTRTAQSCSTLRLTVGRMFTALSQL